MQIEAVIFDKDGVLTDSEKLKADAWQRTLAMYGVQDGATWYLGNLGPSDVELAKMARERFGFEADPDDAAAQWRSLYRNLEKLAEPITQNLRVLVELSRRYPIAVASSMDKATIELEMERFGVLVHITACVSGEDVPNNKPAPDVYLAAAQVLGVRPTRCVAIEDTPAGVTAAKDASMFCVGYRNPRYHVDLSKADLITADLSSIDLFSGKEVRLGLP